MDGVKKITAYKASDGRVFEDSTKACEYQTELRIKARLDDLLENFMYRGIDSHEIKNALFNHRELLKDILNEEV